MEDTPLYVAHIISSADNVFNQKTCSLCVNDFVYKHVGHFEGGKFIPDDIDLKVVYHRQHLIDGYAPPVILVDFIQWMIDNHLWLPWMSEFDQIALVKSSIGGV